MTSEKKDIRRRYDATMKAQVMAACDEPGASVAKVAMAHRPRQGGAARRSHHTHWTGLS